MKNAKEIMEFVKKYGQFPFKEREENYQSYWLNGYGYVLGDRNIKHRYTEMKLPDYGQMCGGVLDLGCQIGSMLQEAYMRGAGPCVGFDSQPEFIECAEMLAEYNKFDISYKVIDLTDTKKVHKTIKEMFPFGVDIVFALSIYKHIRNHFKELISGIDFNTLYIEGHNSNNLGYDTHMNQEIENFLKNSNWKWERLGTTIDKNLRCMWIVRRK